jgi:DNA-directed RNA polymerase subunit RPC12/RpoP
MHDTDDAAIYQWPVCAACGKDLWVNENGRQACRPCEIKTMKRITELPALFVELSHTATLMRGARKPGSATSGSRTPPIPPRLEVLTLTGPGGAAARLAAIEDAWRQALGWTVAPWRGSPAQAVPEHARFLINNLPWACDSYDSIGQDIDDLRRLHAEATAAVSGERKPGRVQTGLCPVPLEAGPCGQQLTATAASHRIRCSTCGTEWDGLAAWRELRLAQEDVLRRDAGVAA